MLEIVKGEKSRAQLSDKADNWSENWGESSDPEISLNVIAIYSMVGSNVSLPEEENTPEKRVDRIFQLMDKVRTFFLYTLWWNCSKMAPILVVGRARSINW